MNLPNFGDPLSEASLEQAAAGWVVRRDRGLSAAEAAEFQLWLAADARHAPALRRAERAWRLLDRIPETAAAPAIEAGSRRRSFWRRGAVALAAAAAIAVMISVRRPETSSARTAASANQAASVAEATDAPRRLMLTDGSVVELNRGSEVREAFTPAERRVALVRGEAYFNVVTDVARPFIVSAAHVDVRAVGTAFNVHLASGAVEVLVTEGVVKLKPSADGAERRLPAADSIPSLTPGQRAVVALAPASAEVAVVVTTMSQAEIARALAWQEPLESLRGATLAEVAANFERRSGRRIILADPALATVRLGGRFRADDAEGFASVLEMLDVEAEHTADGGLVLRKKTSVSR